MYKNFYNFTSRPFELNPDPKFLWLGEKHNEGLAAVRYGIQANTGFLSLTGDVGTGKSTLVNALVNSLGNNVIFAKISDPYLETLDFFNFAANAFGMNKEFSTKGKFLVHLKTFLYTAHTAHKKVLLIIEEAQRLSQALLEEVRLLSNIEKQNAKLINILFVGQNEFIDKLEKNRALKQRLIISYYIQPLTEIETTAYIRHRLRIAGSETDNFSQGAVHEIYSFSKGNPRLINVICDLALLSGYLKETTIIEPQTVKDCAAEYEMSDQKKMDFIEDRTTLVKPIRETGESTAPSTVEHLNQEVSEKAQRKPGRRRAAYFAVILALSFFIIFGYIYFLNGNHASVASLKSLLQRSISKFTVSQPEVSYPNRQIDKAATAGSGTKLLSGISDRGQTTALKPNINAIQQEEIALLQSRLLDLNSQKAADERQLSRLQSDYDALVLELAELKGTKEQVAELENVIAMKAQMFSQIELKLNELEAHLVQEKTSKDRFSAELASKDALVTELQEKLAASQSIQPRLEGEIVRSKEEITQLKGQLSDLRNKQAAAPISPVVLKMEEKLPAEVDSPKTEAESPNPAAIIDWVLKKKSE